MHSEYKSVYLKPNKERALNNRHPWLFSGAVARTDQQLRIGDPVVVRDHGANFLAIGHWCGDHGLVCRLVSFDPKRIVDQAFYRQRFFEAKSLRTGLGLPNAQTNGYRLLNGEGDGLPGLVCDLYAESASIQLSNPGLRAIVPDLSDFLCAECGCEHIFIQDHEEKTTRWLLGGLEECSFREHGLRFTAKLGKGQKTGHFLDQRDNRLRIGQIAHGRVVLDAFSYSGGFSMHALQGNAARVTSVDISAKAIEFCRAQVAENGFHDAHEAIVADCFDYLRQIEAGRYDLMILDPPAFAKTAQAVPQAARGYKDINLNAMKAIGKGGLIFTFSCSQHVDRDLFQKIVFGAAKDSGREVKIISEFSEGPDHPVSLYCPQSRYLKGLGLFVH